MAVIFTVPSARLRTPRLPRKRTVRWFAHGLVIVLVAMVSMVGCAASIPQGQLGITKVDLNGTQELDDAAIKTCIASREREHFGFVLGGDPPSECGTPPFDEHHVPVNLWTWPWTDYPVYDPAVLDRDLDRIERFYRARGYYDAQVTSTRVIQSAPERTVEITADIDEGDPVLVVSWTIEGIAHLDEDLRNELRDAIRLEFGEPFDEYKYDQSKEALRKILGEASYAHAIVEGAVELSREERWARIVFSITAGMPCRFGQVYVSGYQDLTPRPIWGAAAIEEGEPFSISALEDARQAVYALGPFAAVDVEPILDRKSDIVDVKVKVVPGKRTRLAFGVGMEAGGNLAQGAQDAGDSFAQWDVHLLSRFEHRNFLGGMRNLQIEERPRLIFDHSFPSFQRPNLGNALSIDLRQPAFAEARTALISSTRWDLGPDPFGGRFYRSELTTGIGPERRFFGGKLRAASTLNLQLFREIKGIDSGPIPSYEVVYFQHVIQLELRDDPREPRQGAYFSVSVIHAGHGLPGDWDYVRVLPDARGYMPLPFGMVLAARALIGVMEVSQSRIPIPASDPGGFVDRLRRFGPLRHRLRGGGHNSVRGYRPNTLGDAVIVNNRLDSGGSRRWEASLELRIPLTSSFGTVLFADAGDVSQEKRFRFNYPQTTFGFGLRYKTIVGPLRLDAGFAPSNLQVFGKDNRIRDGIPQATILGVADGTVHFTIGEAF